jgi:pilus assembly protein CpaE
VTPPEIGECKVRSGELPNSAAGLCAATLCVDPETAEAVKQAVIRKNGTFAGELEEYSHYKSDPLLLQNMQRAEVPVCVIGFDRDRAAAVEASNAIQQILHGRGNLIAICGKSDPALILEAMRAGCGEYLSQPVAIEQLAEALDRVRTRLNVQKPPSPKPMGRILARWAQGAERVRLLSRFI